MRKCSIDKLTDLFQKISENASLYLPATDNAGGAVYTKWAQGVEYLDVLNTIKSPKDFFFPQSETLMEFKIKGKNIELLDIREESENFVIFGVRACDVKSFDILDRVFLSEPVDSYYQNRRAHGIIISLACTRPSETCFCTTFGIDATSPAGDISTWKTEDALYLQANTEKGLALLEKLSDITEEYDGEEVSAQQEKTRKILRKLPLANLTTEKFGGGKTKEFFDSPLWAELSEACLGCGTCTYVCPTCQCYDIKEFNTGSGVIRYRTWDSCMFSEFTKMAHGNSRNTQTERFRQRFMHKLVYYPENNEGLFSCVGCGRCLSKCPISMNIVKVMKALGGEKK